jgi:Flp pilus assembly protein TadB
LTSAHADLPRAVRNGPPITVKCECGERRDLRYGERWRCDGCGRSYDTNRIPLEEYASLRRNRVRDRILPLIVFTAAAAVALVFVLVGRPLAVVVVVPLTGFLWSSFVRPARRRRQYQAIADRPRWTIESD